MAGDKDKKYNKRNTVVEFTELGKIPPQALELEEAVLGALIIDSGSFDRVIKDFSEGLFYREANRIIANAFIEMYHANQTIDVLTLCQKLRDDKKLDEVGGALYLTKLTGRVASASHVDFHIKILQQKSIQRQIIQICSSSITKAYADEEDVFDVFAELQLKLDDSIKSIMNYEISSIKDIHLSNIEESKIVAETGVQSGVVTGLRLVDKMTSGWQKSDLIIIAGRPSMGKTAVALSMVTFPTIEKDIPVGIFSLEMSKSQLGGRMQSHLSTIDASRIIKKQLEMGEVLHIEKTCGKLLSAPLYIDDTPNISLVELKGKARRLVREKGVKLIVIDYLQLMRSGLDIRNREQEIAEISRGLKGLAKELDIPIIALSQLSRVAETRTDKKPMLADLRESGQIEQDADMVIFCYRPEYYGIDTYEIGSDTLETKGLFLLIVAKHRNGELGEVPLQFIHSLTKVTNHPMWDKQEETTSVGFGAMPQNTEFDVNPSNNVGNFGMKPEEDDLPF